MDTKRNIIDKESTFLVTGGAGFIGSNLCEYLLSEGYNVRCLDNLSNGKKENISNFLYRDNFQFIEGDIRDKETCLMACDGVDYVLHQAAWGSVPRSIKEPLLYEEINIRGTLNMLDAARTCNVKKFVYASSSSVYGSDQNLPKVEGIEGQVLSPYALTKRVNEEYAKLYTELFGLETYGLRYFNVFGKRQDPDGTYAAVIPKFIKQILSNEQPIINGDGEQSRDFTFIENVIDANIKACETSSQFSGQVFNIAFGGSETLNNLFCYLCELLGKDIKPIYGPERIGDIKHSNADITKAKKMLNYNPKWDFKAGLRKAIGWYIKELNERGKE